MPGPLRLAVVGAGHFGRYHVLKAAAEPRVALVGVVDHDPAKAARVAAEGGARGLPDLDAALAAAEAVVVAASTRAHHEIGLRVLEAGRHLFVEKPIATTLAEADELIGRAAARGLVLQVGHLERFSVARSALVRHVGRPVAMEFARLAPYRPRGTDVSVVLDLMIHDIDLALTLAEGAVARVEAVGRRVLSDTLDFAQARLAFAGGAVASLTASRVSPGVERVARLFDGAGSVAVDFVGRRLARFGRDGRHEESWHDADPLAAQLAAFVAAVRGEAEVVVDGAAGRAALAVALAVEQACLSDPSA
ncbi:Gfo/Idh/MocA family protein [Elioraea sp.]|uniref:Gfo/Idh/MocA family protein n=1 Tax=Elioraea sp. TaxID=2185103 RepID=UPI0021DBE925|nr:Gfo/Idh/MocA family oxidoreductase [Elioraea sp.]GIX09244.1 MAG: UDP-N-acetylglucosamine 3-dehydrogenase [Elioraea sp.]